MRRLVIVLCFAVFLAGCGDKKTATAVVSGTITYKGQAVNGGSLILYPATGEGPTVNIPITQSGSFRTSDVPEGEYKVVVQPSAGFEPKLQKGSDPSKNPEIQQKMEQLKQPATIPIPEKYKKRLDTDLKITVTKGEQTITLELKD
jgi:hypothetical protein